MYVVMDMPLATSTEHKWFDESKSGAKGYERVYNWQRSGKASGYWTQDPTKRLFYNHIRGKPDQAVLNLADPQARQLLKVQNCKRFLSAGRLELSSPFC